MSEVEIQTQPNVNHTQHYDYFITIRDTNSNHSALPTNVQQIMETIDLQLENKWNQLKRNSIAKPRKKFPSCSSSSVMTSSSSSSSTTGNPFNANKSKSISFANPVNPANGINPEITKLNRDLNLALNGVTDTNSAQILQKLKTIFQNTTVDYAEIIPIVTEQFIGKAVMQLMFTEYYALLCKELIAHLQYGNKLAHAIKHKILNELKMIETKRINKSSFKGVCMFEISLYLHQVISNDEIASFFNYTIHQLMHGDLEIKGIVANAIGEMFIYMNEKKMDTDIVYEYIDPIQSICNDTSIPMNIKIKLLDVIETYVG